MITIHRIRDGRRLFRSTVKDHHMTETLRTYRHDQLRKEQQTRNQKGNQP